MKISEFISRVDTTKDTVRHYEALGLLQPIVLPNGRRDYGEKDVMDFQAIKEMQALDMTLKEIQVMFEVKRTKGCGSTELLGGVLHTMEEKMAATVEAEKRLVEKRKQMKEMIGVLREVGG
ncbi:MAG TPA: MerR family transcriptional regulator [Bacillota bacterium]|nr:MerR family transcriptional regulator [Bacillota bacterium]